MLPGPVLAELRDMGVRAGRVHHDAWAHCGEIQYLGQSKYDICNEWMAEDYDWPGPPARLGKAMMMDTLGAIQASMRAVATLKADVWRRYPDSSERKAWKHGKSQRRDHWLVVDTGSYSAEPRPRHAVLHVQGMTRGRRIPVPLCSNVAPAGQRMLILRGSRVDIHYAVDEVQACQTRSGGTGVLGMDKGCTAAYTDSDGERHGAGLGALLTTEADRVRDKGRKRDHLRAVARKAAVIAAEDLTRNFGPDQAQGRKSRQRLSAWPQGQMADTLNSVSRRRRTCVRPVNPACTSPMASRTGLLQGHRQGDRFCRVTGEVTDVDHNAACNVRQRLYDAEITVYTPCRKVKQILLDRTQARGGDCSTQARVVRAAACRPRQPSAQCLTVLACQGCKERKECM